MLKTFSPKFCTGNWWTQYLWHGRRFWRIWAFWLVVAEAFRRRGRWWRVPSMLSSLMSLKKLFSETCTSTHKHAHTHITKMYVNNDWTDLCYLFYRTMVWWFWRMLLCITTKNHVSFRLIVTDIYKTEFQYRLNSWDCKYDYDFNIIFWVINITPYIYCNECIGDAALIGSTCTRKQLSWKESKLQWY